MKSKKTEQVIDIKMCEECPGKVPHAFFYTNKGRATEPVYSKEDAIATMNAYPELFEKNRQKLLEKINLLDLKELEKEIFSGATLGELVGQSLLLYALSQILNAVPKRTKEQNITRTENGKLTVRQCETPAFLAAPHGYIITEGGEKYRPGQFFSTEAGKLLINQLFKIDIITEQEKETLIKELQNLELPEKSQEGELNRIKNLITQENKKLIQKDLRKTNEKTRIDKMTITYTVSQ